MFLTLSLFFISNVVAQDQQLQLRRTVSALTDVVDLLQNLDSQASCGVTTNDQNVINLNDSIEQFEHIEQRCISGASEAQEARKYYLKSIDKVILPFRDEFIRLGLLEGDIKTNPIGQITNQLPPENWQRGKNFKGRDEWIEKLTKASKNERCQLIKMAYLSSMWKIIKLKPGYDYQQFSDLLLPREANNEELLRYQEDQKKASWAMRFVTHLPDNIDPNKECLLKDNRGILQEAALRENFIYDKKFNRKPLGFAIGMCGRPMNSHYIDQLVINNERKDPWNLYDLNRWKDEFKEKTFIDNYLPSF